MSEGLTLQAIFTRATTTLDGGWRVTFDCSESEREAVMKLSQMRDLLLQLAVIPIDGMNKLPGEGV